MATIKITETSQKQDSSPTTDRLKVLLRLITHCHVLSRFVGFTVLLRPARFHIRTVTAVANILTVLKSGTAVTAITASQVCPSRRPALPHVHSVFSTVV